MASPGFGFSVGDFITVIKLIGQVTKALKDTDGASDDFRMLQQELKQLQVLIEYLQDPPSKSVGSLTHYHAVRGMALTVQYPLQQLLNKMVAYSVLERGASAPKWKITKRKIQWALGMQQEVLRMRGIVTMKIVSLTTLLVLPLGEDLRELKTLSHQQMELSNQTRHDLDSLQHSVERNGVKTRQVLYDQARSANMDSRRLLQICVGLDVGVRKLQTSMKHAASQQENERRLQIQDTQNFYGAIATISTNIQSRASTTIALVETLLKKLTDFSYDTVARLRDIHLSNLAIYSLLSSIDERLLRSPTNMSDDNITFVDLLNRKQSLPYSAFRHWEVFEAMLICQLKGTPAEGKVLRGEYRISNSNPGIVIDQSDWKRKVFPGASLDMSAIMVMCRVQGDNCPRPHCQGTAISAGVNESRGGPYVCSSCQLVYYLGEIVDSRTNEVVTRTWHWHTQRLLDKRKLPLSLMYLYVCLLFVVKMRRALHRIRMRNEEEEGLGVFRKVEIAPESEHDTKRHCTQIVERYSVCRCLYYKHAIDPCPAYGQRGHVVHEKTVLVGYVCAIHLSH